MLASIVIQSSGLRLRRFISVIGFNLWAFRLKISSASELFLESEKKNTPANILFPLSYFSYPGAAIDLCPNYVVPFSHSPSVEVFCYVRPFSSLYYSLFLSFSLCYVYMCISLTSVFSSLFPALLHLPLDYADVIRTNIRASGRELRGRWTARRAGELSAATLACWQNSINSRN